MKTLSRLESLEKKCAEWEPPPKLLMILPDGQEITVPALCHDVLYAPKGTRFVDVNGTLSSYVNIMNCWKVRGQQSDSTGTSKGNSRTNP